MKKFKKKHIYIGLNLDLFGAIGTFIFVFVRQIRLNRVSRLTVFHYNF